MSSAGPDLAALLALFPPAHYLRHAEPVPADKVPEPYRQLLVHEHHMTVTVEAHHGEIGVDEAPGGGARFRVLFPAGSPPYETE